MPRDEHTAPEGAVWERVEVGQASARDALALSLASVATQDDWQLFHDPAWLLEAEDRTPDRVHVYVCRLGDRVVAYAPFVEQPWSMRCRAGEVTLASLAFDRLHIHGGPVIATEAAAHAQALVEKLLAQLRPQLAPRHVVYFEGVEVGGPIERAIRSASAAGAYDAIEPSPRYERSLIDLPASYDVYLASLKSQTRQNLRNSHRKLERHLAGKLSLRCYTDADAVHEFVERAAAISATTYQWHLLGLGLREPEKLVRTLRAMAARGWTRCYLLECDGQASAFMIGYLYRGTYYYVDIGFDPQWEKWSVGTVLHLEVLRDLMDGGSGARALDFSSGTGVHKKRFGNRSRPEASYVLVPRRWRNRVSVGGIRGAQAAADALVGLLERLHVKAAVKRLVRRRSVARSTPREP